MVTIYMGKSVGPHFVQMVSKTLEVEILFEFGVQFTGIYYESLDLN